MFEKEAEEYTKQRAKVLGINDLNLAYHAMQRAYQYGAEFGYNKAKEEMIQNGLALQSDMNKTIEQNIQLKKQIEKMKCCDNCEHNFDVDGTRSNHCVKCKNFSNWELDKE